MVFHSTDLADLQSLDAMVYSHTIEIWPELYPSNIETKSFTLELDSICAVTSFQNDRSAISDSIPAAYSIGNG